VNRKGIFLIVVLGAGVLLALNTFFTVDQTQSAIIIQLGKPVRTITSPGLQMKVPFIQDVVYFHNRILNYDAEPKEIITRDKKTLVVDNFAKWRILDPLKVYQSVRDEKGAQSRLDDIIYSELRVDLGTKDLTEIVSGVRAEIMQIVTKASTEKAATYGLEILDVRIKRADLPPENEKAVYARMQSEREREAKRYRSEGEEEAQKIRSTAEKERQIILAEAYKTSQEVMGKGDATAFKRYAAAYEQDPEFFEFTRSMEAYKKALKSGSVLVTNADGDFFKYLKRYQKKN
jgi:membrane protease subunit HflC